MYEGFYISDDITDSALAGTPEALELEKLLTAVDNRTIVKHEQSDGIIYQFKEGLRIRTGFIATGVTVGVQAVVINPDALDMSSGIPHKTVQTTPVKVWMSFAGTDLTLFEEQFNAADEKAVDSENDIYYFYAEPIVDPKLSMSRDTPDILNTATTVDPTAPVDPAVDPADSTGTP